MLLENFIFSVKLLKKIKKSESKNKKVFVRLMLMYREKNKFKYVIESEERMMI